VMVPSLANPENASTGCNIPDTNNIATPPISNTSGATRVNINPAKHNRTTAIDSKAVISILADQSLMFKAALVQRQYYSTSG
jgi:hypothetical protein